MNKPELTKLIAEKQPNLSVQEKEVLALDLCYVKGNGLILLAKALGIETNYKAITRTKKEPKV